MKKDAAPRKDKAKKKATLSAVPDAEAAPVLGADDVIAAIKRGDLDGRLTDVVAAATERGAASIFSGIGKAL
jgi:hypothetical protein